MCPGLFSAVRTLSVRDTAARYCGLRATAIYLGHQCNGKGRRVTIVVFGFHRDFVPPLLDLQQCALQRHRDHFIGPLDDEVYMRQTQEMRSMLAGLQDKQACLCILNTPGAVPPEHAMACV